MDYDLFVIGAGSGGLAAAKRAVSYGARVAIVEREQVGGTCVIRGCIPKKLMVYATRYGRDFEDARGFGWDVGETRLDFRKLAAARDQEVERLRQLHIQLLEKVDVELLTGNATLTAPHTVELNGRKINAKKILLATGGEAYRPPIPGMELAVTSREFFELRDLPQRAVVLGGGYIACEFASILSGLGSEVTIVIRRDRILRGFDDEIREFAQQGLIERGINVLAETQVKAIEKANGALRVDFQGSDKALEADVVLAALGRRPNVSGLGLDKAGVEVRNGAVHVDAYSRTTQSHIFAVGDCTDRMNLTPVAITEGRAFADAVFGGKPLKSQDYDHVPTAVFTDPEIASVGLSEAEAREKYGEAIRVYKANFRPMLHSLSGRKARVLTKLVTDEKTGRVLGAHMAGDHAAEIIQGLAIPVRMGATKQDFDDTMALHPSTAEEFVLM